MRAENRILNQTKRFSQTGVPAHLLKGTLNAGPADLSLCPQQKKAVATEQADSVCDNRTAPMMCLWYNLLAGGQVAETTQRNSVPV